MKTLLISSLAFAMLAGGAWAETPPPPPPGPAPGMKAPPPPPPGGPDAMDEGPDGPPPPPGGPRGRRPPPPPPPSKAAHFRIEHGDTVVDVKCADEEPAKTCGDFTLQLLDRVQTPAPAPAKP
jgi:hypothetical protein